MSLKHNGLTERIKVLWLFITEDIWRTTPSELTDKQRKSYTILKIITLAIRRYRADHLQRNASALTYSMFLSLIPTLAVLLSIAKGFGFQNIVESQLFQYFPGQQEVFSQAFTFVDSYMQHAKGGVFLGLGLLLLFYTVYMLIANIENTFNMVWQIPKGRKFSRQLTDYFSAFLLLPVFLVCSAGLSFLTATTFDTLKEYQVIGMVSEIGATVIPLLVSILMFTGLYIFIPNTSVRLRHAIVGGVFAGIFFHLLQHVYISGQIWVSSYNAIYGSFAFIPLLLLWMQLSWVICLIGAEITFACQNVQNFDYELDSQNISRRYLDFVILSMAALIFQRFETGEKAYSDTEISTLYKIPIRLTKRVLLMLVDLGFINEIKDDNNECNYQPAVDINHVTVAHLFEVLEKSGAENFKIEKNKKFQSEWNLILQSRKDMFLNNNELLVKDLK
ncbi:MAG: YihY/virulence factor BrkB family protein [Candidatus Symbiothrix sp.]|jgi:membrane protein|nr:YihY/virulence factor BrkB family protein [Candidatus Symbiothrix sp.]